MSHTRKENKKACETLSASFWAKAESECYHYIDDNGTKKKIHWNSLFSRQKCEERVFGELMHQCLQNPLTIKK